MSRPPPYADRKNRKQRPLEGVLVPRDASAPVIVKAISNNPELERYAELTALHILQTWSALATVDVSEIVRVERRCCRFCHGIDHRFQWVNDEEWAHAVAIDLDTKKPPRGCEGGFGFDPKARPSESCHACHGEGDPFVFLADYRDLSPAARLLYNGAKHGKYGIEVMMRDRDKLMEMAGKYLGMFKEIHEHGGKNGGAIQMVLSPAEAAV